MEEQKNKYSSTWYESYSNDSCEYCYVPILKNAHSSGIEFFQNNFDFKKIDYRDRQKYIVFLREPVKRWLSAVAQWFDNPKLELPDNYKIDNIMLEMIFSAIEIDNHATPQIDIVSVLPYYSCVFFNTEDIRLEEKLHHFCINTLNFNKEFIPLPKYNKSNTKVLKQNIIKQLKDAMNNNKNYKEKIFSYYEKDIRLYANCAFYNI